MNNGTGGTIVPSSGAAAGDRHGVTQCALMKPKEPCQRRNDPFTTGRCLLTDPASARRFRPALRRCAFGAASMATPHSVRMLATISRRRWRCHSTTRPSCRPRPSSSFLGKNTHTCTPIGRCNRPPFLDQSPAPLRTARGSFVVVPFWFFGISVALRMRLLRLAPQGALAAVTAAARPLLKELSASAFASRFFPHSRDRAPAFPMRCR